jgi:hypothetical protein
MLGCRAGKVRAERGRGRGGKRGEDKQKEECANLLLESELQAEVRMCTE